MDRFIEFNPVKFLQESRGWRRRIQELRAQLDTLYGLDGVENDGMPHGTDISDTTGNKAIKVQSIKGQIEELEYYISMLTYARGVLSQEENEVIDIFFFKGGYMPPKIEAYGMKYGLCRSDVYSARRKALDHISSIIVERI